MKKPSPYPLISWAMDLKLTPALNSIRDRHAQAVAVPAAAVDDGLKVGDNKKAAPGGVAFFCDGGVQTGFYGCHQKKKNGIHWLPLYRTELF
jgi:hypothetical protein